MKKIIVTLAVLFMLLGQAQTAKAADSTFNDTTTVTVSDNVGKPVAQVIDSIFRPLDRSAMPNQFFGDQAFSFVNYRLYDGTLNDSNYVAFEDMASLYGFYTRPIPTVPTILLMTACRLTGKL